MATLDEIYDPRSGYLMERLGGARMGGLSGPGTQYLQPQLTRPRTAGFARGERSDLAFDAMKQAELMEAERDNALLRSAQPFELENLFGTPRTEREARLQAIVQKDYNARERGNKLIWSEPQKTAYNQKVANLQRTNLANMLDPLEFNLNAARFGETQENNLRNYFNQLATRQHARDQLAAQERYRDVQARNAEANRTQRERLHMGDYGQRERFHGDTVANQGLQAMMELERMLQARANAEAGQNRGYYQDVAGAAAAGALPPGNIGPMFAERFDPQTLAMLEGYAGRAGEDIAFRRGEEVPSFTPTPWNLPENPELARIGQEAPSYASPMADDEADSLMDSLALPDVVAPRPTPQRQQQFQEGATVRNRRTGQIFRVQGGQLVRVR